MTDTPRTQIRLALQDALPPNVFQVFARDASPDAITRPTVIVRMDKVRPAPNVGPTSRSYQAGLIVTVPEISPDKYATSLDLALEDVLYALDVSESLTWTEAGRVVLAGTQTPGYEIVVTVHTTHERL